MVSSIVRQVALSENAILKLLPHRRPFLFVGHAIENTVGKNISVVTKLDRKSMISRELQILEGLGQTSALLILQMDKYKEKGIPVFAAMRNVCWTRVKASDEDLLFSAKMIRASRANFGIVHAFAHTENEKICSGDLMFSFTAE